MMDAEMPVEQQSEAKDEQQQEETATSANNNKSKKFLYKRIREQMEFYFSDSNLSKDRFLIQEIQKSEDQFIDLSLFLKFNKIQHLSTDINKLIKSINKSEFLELNENKSKVRRRVPFVETDQSEIDKRTVYVENLPLHVNHDLLKRLFTRCGNVTYVSLPKYKSTGQIKGFAFIEFDTKDAAKNAIRIMNDSFEDVETEAGKFPKYNKKITTLEKKIQKTAQELGLNEDEIVSEPEMFTDDDVQQSNDKDAEKKKKSKRKLSKINDSLEKIEQPQKKERKTDATESEIEQGEQTATSGLDTDDVMKKKKKNRRKKHSSSKNAKKKELQEESILLHLRVLPKKEWLRLKKDYLQKQKENFTHLKEKLNTIREKKLQKTVEKYLKKPTGTGKVVEQVKPNDIEAGSIIKLKPLNMINNAMVFDGMFKLSQQKFRDEYLKEINTDIAYVDLDKNTYKIYIRCKDKNSSSLILSKLNTLTSISQLFQMHILDGNEEGEYLSRIEMNRNKLQVKKEKKLRGKSKIAKGAYNLLSAENNGEETAMDVKEDESPKQKPTTSQSDLNVASQKKTHIKFDEE